MKICVLGNGILAEDFKRMNFVVLNDDIYSFDTKILDDYDTIINTHDYGCYEGDPDAGKMVRVNVNFSAFISEYCQTHKKRYVYITSGDIYGGHLETMDEASRICASNGYQSSKVLGELRCDNHDLIIRAKNIFNDTVTNENALYRAVTTDNPTLNRNSYTWTVDLIRAIVVLLKKKKHGIYNISSDGTTSQFAIRTLLDINTGIQTQGFTNDHHRLNCSALNKEFTPMDLSYNLRKCYGVFRSELEDNE